jgi:demethylspheroidene O-methyltransferase
MQSQALADRWFNWRNRLLASDVFRRWASRFAPTRWLARRRAARLFDLVAGFVYSQVLLACVRLGLFELLADGPMCRDMLAARMVLDGTATDRLLAAACALQLVERRGDKRYGLGLLGAVMAHNPALTAMVEHHRVLYADLADPVALLRGTPTSRQLHAFWPYAGATGNASTNGSCSAAAQAYCALMATSQPLVAEELLDTHALQKHRMLLDIGGGDGSFLVHAAQRAPDLELALFDLPAVAAQARQRVARNGLAHRCTIHSGDFRSDPLPRGADVATLVRVVHDHDDATVRQLLVAVRQALEPGGTLLLAEPMADTPGAQAMGDAYFGFYLLAMGSGRPRSCGQLAALLSEAGFVAIRPLPTRIPLQTSVLLARTPAKHMDQEISVNFN